VVAANILKIIVDGYMYFLHQILVLVKAAAEFFLLQDAHNPSLRQGVYVFQARHTELVLLFHSHQAKAKASRVGVRVEVVVVAVQGLSLERDPLAVAAPNALQGESLALEEVAVGVEASQLAYTVTEPW